MHNRRTSETVEQGNESIKKELIDRNKTITTNTEKLVNGSWLLEDIQSIIKIAPIILSVDVAGMVFETVSDVMPGQRDYLLSTMFTP